MKCLSLHEALRTSSCTEEELRDFPGGPVVRTLPSTAGHTGLIPGQRAKIPISWAVWPKKKKEELKVIIGIILR